MVNEYSIMGKIRKSNMRLKILELLFEEKTPNDIAKLLDKHQPSISKAIISMTKDGLVKCLNPNDASYRYYVITPYGKEILHKMKKKA